MEKGKEDKGRRTEGGGREGKRREEKRNAPPRDWIVHDGPDVGRSRALRGAVRLDHGAAHGVVEAVCQLVKAIATQGDAMRGSTEANRGGCCERGVVVDRGGAEVGRLARLANVGLTPVCGVASYARR